MIGITRAQGGFSTNKLTTLLTTAESNTQDMQASIDLHVICMCFKVVSLRGHIRL